MTDLVVTVPRDLWSEWIEEGDAVGSPETGEEWGFFLGHSRPPIEPGDRLYIVAHDRLRGYAPVTRVAFFIDNCPDHTVSEAMMAQNVGGIGYDCEWCRKVLDACTFFGSDARPRINGKVAPGRWVIGRKGGAVAVTIPEHVRGFQGWRERWWDRGLERPFPGWSARRRRCRPSRRQARQRRGTCSTEREQPVAAKVAEAMNIEPKLAWGVDSELMATGARLSQVNAGQVVIVMSGQFTRRLCLVGRFVDEGDERRILVDMDSGETLEPRSPDLPVVLIQGPYRLSRGGS